MTEEQKLYGGMSGSPWYNEEGRYCDRCSRFTIYEYEIDGLNVCSRCYVELEEDD